MNNSLKIETRIFASQCDDKQLLRTDAILNFFQDLATAHAIEMETDYNTLKARSNAFWVISKVKFKKSGIIRHNDPVFVSTWPIKPQGVRFLRDFHICGQNGEIHGASEWCILDFNTMGLRRLDSVCYPASMPHLEDRAKVSPFLRLREETCDGDYNYTYFTGYADIDVNGHVNNAVYSKMALNCFTPDEFSKLNYNAFEIHFLSQCFLGDKIKIFKKQVDSGIYIEGKIEDKAVFKCLFYNE